MFNFINLKPKRECFWKIKEREAKEDYDASISLNEMKIKSDEAIANHKTDKPAFVIRMTRDGQFRPEKLEISTNLFPHHMPLLSITSPRVRVKTENPFGIIEDYRAIDGPFETKEEAAQSIVNYTNTGMVVAEYDYPPLKPRT